MAMQDADDFDPIRSLGMEDDVVNQRVLRDRKADSGNVRYGGKRTFRAHALDWASTGRARMEADYLRLKARWQTGGRDREGALHLLFLGWMHWAEPDCLTGLAEDPNAADLWHQIYSHFGGEASSDPEFLFVASLMADLFPWGLGDVAEWEGIAKRLAARSLDLRPEGFSVQTFKDRSDYGDYFQIHARKEPEPGRQ